MEHRLITRTAILALLVWAAAACSNDGGDPFGSSAGGGAGGAGVGTTQMVVLANGVPGAYGAAVLTDGANGGPGALAAGPADPLEPGGTTSLNVSGWSSGMASMNIFFPAGTANLPSYGLMKNWTLQFDLQLLTPVSTTITAGVAANVMLYWSDAVCPVSYLMPPLSVSSPGWVHYSVTPAMFKFNPYGLPGSGSGCTYTNNSPVTTVFSLQLNPTTAVSCGCWVPGFNVSNIKWTR